MQTYFAIDNVGLLDGLTQCQWHAPQHLVSDKPPSGWTERCSYDIHTHALGQIRKYCGPSEKEARLQSWATSGAGTPPALPQGSAFARLRPSVKFQFGSTRD